mgnify:CR=1 FL=1|tara:strand:+ start:4264 stop:6393 length:2130 start_codon:yes stop_codon:yes gene_type:complete
MKKLFITFAALFIASPVWAACIPSGVTDQYIYFVAVDSTDFTTRETGLTTFTVYRSRNGAAAAAMTTPTINETDSTNMPGVYELLLDEDMTISAGNDVEEMVFHITQASMAAVTRTIELCRPKITAGNTLDVTATGEAGLNFSNTAGTIDAAEIGTDAITATKIAASAIGASEIATDAIGAAEIATAAITNAEVSFDGSELTAIPWNASWDTEVESEANDAIVANHLDHLLAADYDPATPPGVSTAWINELVESDAGVTRFTVNALEQGPSGSGASAASIADAVWDEAQADHVTAGSFGVTASEIASILADTGEIGSAGAGLTAVPYNSAWDADIQSEANDAIVANHLDHLLAVDYDPATPPGVATAWMNELVESDAGVTRYTVNALENGPSGSGASAATIADAVWDEARSGHVTAGSFGEYVLADVQLWDGTTVTTPLETSSDIADAVWDETQSTHTTAGSFGETATEIASILVDTTEIGAAGAGLTGVPYNSAWDTDIESEVNDALIAQHLDHLFAANYDPASKPGSATALLNELVEDDAGVSRYTVNALENAPSGSGASAASIADAVWDEAQADHVTAGSFGVTASEIASILTDTGTTGVAIAADAIGAGQIAADAIGSSEIAADAIGSSELATTAANEVRDALLAATVDGTIDLQCALALAVAYGSGDWDLAGSTVTYRNPGDTADRIVGTTSASAFDATTITCP